MTTPRTKFALILEDAAPGDKPTAIYRMRGILKTLLRAWGFRCVSVTQIKEPNNDDQGTGPAGPADAGSDQKEQP